MGDLLKGKRGLVMGVANERSIAWGIARALADQGAELAFSYQGEAFGKRVEPLAASVGSDLLVDVDELQSMFQHADRGGGRADRVPGERPHADHRLRLPERPVHPPPALA